MKLFYTNSSAKEEIGNLESRISELEATNTANADKVNSLQVELANAGETISSLTTERDEAIAAFNAAEAASKSATEELAAANEKLATFEAKVETAAQAKFESLGGPPIVASGNEEKEAQADHSALTGLAKVTAVFKAQNAAKSTK